jgi:hypothetical protein
MMMNHQMKKTSRRQFRHTHKFAMKHIINFYSGISFLCAIEI